MKKLFYCSCTCLFFISCFPKQACTQPTMFRGSPDHNYTVNAKAATAFDELAWKFDAAAPLRSTVAASNSAVFFGSSKGLFYSLNKLTGKVNWVFNAGNAINSSAALHNGNVFFSDNGQTLYSLNAGTGKVNYKTALGQSKSYEWAFDYYYSSPAVVNDQIFVGSKDGCVYDVNENTGQVRWKFKTGGIVRSSPAVAGGVLYAGDTDGSLFAIDTHNGKQLWRFSTVGHGLKSENYGYDRRAIIASPVVTGDKVIVGGRDGFLYAVDKTTGKELWRMNHEISWVISTVAIKGDMVVTGTSDGHFVQAINLATGKQIWKYHTSSTVWSSPVIDGDKVYVGSQEGVLYCIDLKTGSKINAFQAGDIIFSSPVIAGSLLYFGCDDGYLYALKPGAANYKSPQTAKKYDFWDPAIQYFRYGTDIKIKQYLSQNGYTVLDKEKLLAFFKKNDSSANTVIVFATNFFPPDITSGADHSLLRDYLKSGGKVVVTNINPVLFKSNPKDGSLSLRSYYFADSVLSIKYGPDDLRSYKGSQPAFPTKSGMDWGLHGFWTAPLSLPANQVDIVLGKDENGLASAWVKKFNPAPGSGFVQIWINEHNADLAGIVRVAEYGLR